MAQPSSLPQRGLVSQRVRTDLLEAIEAGQYQPGQRLPSTREVAKKYGISHVVVAEAINQLVESGYILKKHGVGMFVSPDLGTPGSEILRVHSRYPIPPELQSALDRFRARFSHLTVEVIPAVRDADVEIFGTTGVNGRYRDHAILPLDDFMASSGLRVEDFHPVGIDIGTVGGSVWALPFELTPMYLAYNPSLLDARDRARIDTWTLDDLLEASRRLHAELGPKGIRAVNTSYSFFSGVHPFLAQFGGHVVDETCTRCLLSSTRSLAAFRFGRELLESVAEFTPWKLCALENLANGQLAIRCSFRVPFPPPHLHKGKSPPYQVAPLPLGRSSGGLVAGLWLAISARARSPRTAWKLLEFLTGMEEQRELNRTTFLLPGRRDALEELLKMGKGAYDLVARTAWQPYGGYPRISTEDHFFINQALDGWWKEDDLPTFLRRTCELVDARLCPMVESHTEEELILL